MIEEFLTLFQTGFYQQVFYYIRITWPVWLPLALWATAINLWLDYKRRSWILDQGQVLLEVRLPRNIEKSPVAMEQVISGLYDAGVGNLGDVYIKGRVRDWFSLEIVSLGGQVKFYIWAFAKWKNVIESRIYAHYPNVEIHEVPDYAKEVVFDKDLISVWGAGTGLVKSEAFPIKTYIDYELDKPGKEQEEIVDPIVSVLEYLGSLKPNEQAWIQILIRAHRKEGLLDGRLIPKGDWTEGAKGEIKKIIEKEAFVKSKEEKGPSLSNLTDAQDKIVNAIERKLSKLPYDTMMRMVYTAPKNDYDGKRIGGILGSFRSFGSQNMNGIKPSWSTGIDYPWRDFRDKKKNENQEVILEAYKSRSFFNPPYKNLGGNSYVLSTEELATLFHFPGATASTPTLTRVPSKKAEAPANLPM